MYMFVCLITIDHTLLSMFCSRFITLWKSPMNPPLASEITAFESPLPLAISNDLPWGGGGVMDIFWNHTIHVKVFLTVKLYK